MSMTERRTLRTSGSAASAILRRISRRIFGSASRSRAARTFSLVGPSPFTRATQVHLPLAPLVRVPQPLPLLGHDPLPRHPLGQLAGADAREEFRDRAAEPLGEVEVEPSLGSAPEFPSSSFMSSSDRPDSRRH